LNDQVKLNDGSDCLTSESVGSIVVAGCGAMGLPMAQCLLGANFIVHGFDVRPINEFGQFSGYMLSDAAQIETSDVLLCVVRDEAQILDLCFEQQCVFGRDKYPSILVICSTVSPRFIKSLATRLPTDVILIDAPMSGAAHGAQGGALTFMVGGSDSSIKHLMPVFQAMGRQIFIAGKIGAGMTLKVLNNYVTANSVAAVRRVHDMASVLGVDQGQLRQVMAASSGSTWFGNQFDQIDWSREGYDIANTIGILEKDVLSAIDALEPQTSLTQSGLDQAILSALRALNPVKAN
jgi:3-hydroxyisobutyrate dehydrogenase-like beta-hydroxyacid dehydrogenase